MVGFPTLREYLGKAFGVEAKERDPVKDQLENAERMRTLGLESLAEIALITAEMNKQFEEMRKLFCEEHFIIQNLPPNTTPQEIGREVIKFYISQGYDLLGYDDKEPVFKKGNHKISIYMLYTPKKVFVSVNKSDKEIIL